MTDEKPTTKAETEYVVLRVREGVGSDDPQNIYAEIGRVTARTAKAAIQEKQDSDGQYVAVPARSMKPVTVKVERVEKVTLT